MVKFLLRMPAPFSEKLLSREILRVSKCSPETKGVIIQNVCVVEIQSLAPLALPNGPINSYILGKWF